MAGVSDDQPHLAASSIYHVAVDPETIIKWNTKKNKAFFDDTNKELLLLKPQGVIKRIPIDGIASKKQYQMPLEDVKAIKFSPDGSFITLQRTDSDVEFYNTHDNFRFKQPIKTNPKVENKILGFFWTNSANLIIITRQGVELFALSKSNTLTRVNEFKLAVNWFVYSAQLRILLLSTGPKENVMHGLHFKLQPNKWLQLPKFTIQLSSEKELLREKDLFISLVYSKVYCIHAYAKQRELHLYHLTTDAIKKQLVIDLHATGTCFISVIDNLIVAHNVSQKVSMIFDINARHPRDNHISFPLAAPLPLAPIKLPQKSKPAEMAPSSPGDSFSELYEEWQFVLPRHAVDNRCGYVFSFHIALDAVCLSFSDRIKLVDFLVRRSGAKEMVLQALRQMIEEKEPLITIAQIFDMLNDILLAHTAEQSRIAAGGASNLASSNPAGDFTNSPAGSAPNSPTPSRSPSASGGLNTSSTLTLDGFSSAIRQADDLSSRRTEYFMNEYKRQQQKAAGAPGDDLSGSSSSSSSSSGATSAPAVKPAKTVDGKTVIEQEDMYEQVFVPIEERRSADHKTMVAVIEEYIRSLSFHRLQVHSFIYELIIDLLVRNNRFYQLHQLLQYHVLSDSIHVACQLLSLASSYPAAMQLSLDMFKRLGEPHQILEILLSQNMLLQAMRFLKSLPTPVDVRAFVPRFLSEARKMNDMPLFFTAFNFFRSRGELDPKECKDHITFFDTTNSIAELVPPNTSPPFRPS
eukprot:TRINITY_DN14182_c0_g1_i1.p1 TRINITY_DN14182_c0_g1~~TRINITY_DN14182_c0_g1_i1.p1  ORF type:complete len:758 (+),score=141.94 TRINITY_DN14182_c0_g1_i1:36-2276(+)